MPRQRKDSRSKGGTGGVGEADILDTSEQEALIKELRAQADSLAKRTRAMFAYLYIGIAFVFVLTFIYTLVYPYDADHQEVFKGLVPLEFIQAFYLLSSSQFFFSAKMLLDSREKIPKWMLFSIAGIAIGTLLVWTYFFAVNAVTNIVLYWLPLANGIGALWGIYVDSDATRIVRDAGSMEHLKYEFKKV